MNNQTNTPKFIIGQKVVTYWPEGPEKNKKFKGIVRDIKLATHNRPLYMYELDINGKSYWNEESFIKSAMKTGIELIAEERERQIEEEGFTAERDDQYRKCELSLAAACYAAFYPIYRHVKSDQGHQFYKLWPWAEEWYKTSPDNRLRDLQKAGALIAAEIDRLQRLYENE